MGIADSTRRSGGGSSFGAGLSAGIQSRKLDIQEEQQARENAVTTYSAQKGQITDNALKTYNAIQDRQAAFLIQHEKNVGGEGGMTPTQFASKNVEFETQKKLAEAQSMKMVDSLEQSSQVGVQMGYFDKGDISNFKQSISPIFQGLTKQERAQVDALPAGAKKASEAEAVGEMVNMIGPKGERVSVSVTNAGAIKALQDKDYQKQTPVSIGVQAKDMEGIGLSKPTQTHLQKKLVQIHDSISRLSELKTKYKPEFQTAWKRASMKWEGMKEKAGFKVDKEDQAGFDEFTKYKRESLSNINEEIHRLTGAQMSKFEAKRIRKGLPDPGEGIVDGDSPSEFPAKLDSTLDELKAIARRYEFFLKNGISGDIEQLSRQYSLETFMDDDEPDKKGDLTPAQMSRLEELRKTQGVVK